MAAMLAVLVLVLVAVLVVCPCFSSSCNVTSVLVCRAHVRDTRVSPVTCCSDRNDQTYNSNINITTQHSTAQHSIRDNVVTASTRVMVHCVDPPRMMCFLHDM